MKRMVRLGARFMNRKTFDLLYVWKYNCKLHTCHSKLIQVVDEQVLTITQLENQVKELTERLRVLEGISAQMSEELDRLWKENWKYSSQVESLEGWETVARQLQKERELEVVSQAKASGGRGAQGRRGASPGPMVARRR